MEQKQIKYTEDELAKMFFEQILLGMMDGMSNMKNDIVKINSEINKLKLFQEEKDLDEELPNVGITINNKLVEIYQEFKSCGIEMFAGYDEKRGVQIRGIVPAYIIENLINNYAVPLSNEMFEYLTTATVMKTLKETNEKEMQKRGPIGKGIMLIKAMINPNNSIYFEEEEIEALRKYLDEYKNINDSVYKYNLQDNLLEAILKHFENTEMSLEEIEESIRVNAFQTLEKLGMKDKIEELKKQIQERFGNRKKKSWELNDTEKQKIQEKTELGKNEECIVEYEIEEK